MKRATSDQEARALRDFLSRTTGLRFGDDRLPFLAGVLADGVRRIGANDAAAYLELAARNPAELSELARAVTIGETYFLRDADQFRAFAALARAREASGARTLRVLSAGCSSGEEAYSLAITLREALLDRSDWDIQVVGFDLDRAAVERAREARYSAWSLRETPETIREKYFREEGRHFVLSEPTRSMVRYRVGNLVAPASWAEPSFDVVFCRNVLMYFTQSAARKVVEGLASALVPGGHLFLGHAENLRGISDRFVTRQSHKTFYYEHDGASADIAAPSPECAPAHDVSWSQSIAEASRRIEGLSRAAVAPAHPASLPPASLEPLFDLIASERFQEALAALDHQSAESSEATLVRAVAHLGQGELAEAERLSQSLLAAGQLRACAHYVISLCREHEGARDAAVMHGSAAVRCADEFAMPRLLLGRLARRAGDFETARAELAHALRLLPGETRARVALFGGGFSRGALVTMCRSELVACGGGP